jgi:hypothetical protein
MLNLRLAWRRDVQTENETELEELVLDYRGGLSPSEMVELRLAAILKNCGQGLSHIIVCRRSSRDHESAT